MTKPSHNSRRRRRVGQHMIHTSLLTLDLTSEEILTALEPSWFQAERDSARGLTEQVRTDEEAA